MPYRWITCPFASYTLTYSDGVIDTAIRAKVSTIIDPGKGKYYSHRPVIHVVKAQRTWCVCIVHGIDWTPVNADAEITNLFSDLVSEDFEIPDGQLVAFHLQQPNELGWSAARLIRIRNRLIARGVDTTGLTGSSQIWRWLDRCGQVLDPNFSIQQITFKPVGG